MLSDSVDAVAGQREGLASTAASVPSLVPDLKPKHLASKPKLLPLGAAGLPHLRLRAPLRVPFPSHGRLTREGRGVLQAIHRTPSWRWMVRRRKKRRRKEKRGVRRKKKPDSSENRESSSLSPWIFTATRAFSPCWTKDVIPRATAAVGDSAERSEVDSEGRS